MKKRYIRLNLSISIDWSQRFRSDPESIFFIIINIMIKLSFIDKHLVKRE